METVTPCPLPDFEKNPYDEKRDELFVEESLESMANQMSRFAKGLGLTIEINAPEDYGPTIRIFKWKSEKHEDGVTMTEARVDKTGAALGLIDKARASS